MGEENMANLVNGATFRFAANVVQAAIDNNGVQYERSKQYDFNPGVVLYADALAALGSLVTELAATSESDIIRYDIIVIFDVTTGPVTVVGNVRKEAILTLRKDGASKKLTHTIFSPADAMVSGNSVVTTAALQTYLDNFEVGGDFVISDGESISVNEATRIAASRVRHVSGPKK